MSDGPGDRRAHHAPGESEHGLKANAIGFVDALVIGLASTAPAYSLAAVIGIVVVIAGVQAPAVLLASFVPMFFIAAAFYYMNRADQDCGTTFSWVTRALGPWPGWMGGWAICTTGILVVGSLADVAARYTFVLIGADGAADSKAAVTVFAVGIIALMTLICVLGTDLSARLQNWLIGAQIGALLLFAGVAIWKVVAGDAPDGSLDPQLSWLSPFAIDSTSRARRRPAHRRVHLLGLGERGQPHRGGRGLRHRARQGGGAVDRDPARDVRVGRDRGGRVRRASTASPSSRTTTRSSPRSPATCSGRRSTSSS